MFCQGLPSEGCADVRSVKSRITGAPRHAWRRLAPKATRYWWKYTIL